MPGPPPLPAEVKKLRGTFRPHRDGPTDHAMDELPADAIERPEHLTGVAADLWDKLIPGLAKINVVRNIDVPHAAAMCRWFATWHDLHTRLEQYALAELDFGDDLDAEHEHEKFVALVQRRASNAWKNFSGAAAKLGLSPADRARIRRGETDDPKGKGKDTSDPLAFFGLN